MTRRQRVARVVGRLSLCFAAPDSGAFVEHGQQPRAQTGARLVKSRTGVLAVIESGDVVRPPLSSEQKGPESGPHEVPANCLRLSPWRLGNFGPRQHAE